MVRDPWSPPTKHRHPRRGEIPSYIIIQTGPSHIKKNTDNAVAFAASPESFSF